MQAKYRVPIFNIAKVMANVKVFRRTHRLTDRLTDSSTAICHPIRGIKMYAADKNSHVWTTTDNLKPVHFVYPLTTLQNHKTKINYK